jgi:lipooligosaccharide transport system ATP-binding protein
LRGVKKRFGNIQAVDGLELDVETGTCVGLLGPNGAGKTTTMRMLTAQAIADEGEIEVLGYRLPGQSKQVRGEMGVAAQIDNIDIELTARENLAVFARIYRVRRRYRREAIDDALEFAGLTDRADAPVTTLSGGMRRRLLITRSLVHRPRLALLDEPTVGLDPQARQELWTLIDGLRTGGMTVLITTHYIEEAEALADTVAIIDKGRVIEHAPPADLIATHAGREVVEVYGPPDHLAEAESWGYRQGYLTRRAGLAVAFLKAEEGHGFPEGRRRAANLEDAYSVLTGAVHSAA